MQDVKVEAKTPAGYEEVVEAPARSKQTAEAMVKMWEDATGRAR